jgi:hypothetical protein
VAKDITFNLRLDADDRKRLDVIANEYCAPRATALRILIKKEHDRLLAEKRQRYGGPITRGDKNDES